MARETEAMLVFSDNRLMETRKRSKEEWTRRYIAFIFILFVIAFGTSLSIRANLGSSPISARPISCRWCQA